MTGHISNQHDSDDSNDRQDDRPEGADAVSARDGVGVVHTARDMPVLVAELQAVIGAHLDTVRACAVAWERSDQVDEQDRSAALDEAALRGKHELASGMLLWSGFGDLERLAAVVAASGAAPGVRIGRSPSPLAGDLPWQQDLASAVATIEGRPEDGSDDAARDVGGAAGPVEDVPGRPERPERERLDERPDFLFLRMPVDEREEFAQWWLGVKDDVRCVRAWLLLNARPDALRERFAARVTPQIRAEIRARVRRARLGVWSAAVGIIAATWGLGMLFDLISGGAR